MMSRLLHRAGPRAAGASAAALAAAVLALAPSPPAAAGAARVWVSGHGVDQAGCGAPTAPCRSLQYAHDDAVAAGGEIDILDPAGYGAITITKAVSIVNDGVGTAGVQAASGDAISINAGPSDVIYLKGLNIDGVGGAGSNGVTFHSGEHLVIDDCTVRRFQHVGVNVVPTSGGSSIVVLGSVLSDNLTGFKLLASAAGAVSAVLDDDALDGNSGQGAMLASNNASAAATVTISNSQASLNGVGVTVQATAGSLVAEINASKLDSNLNDGIFAQGSSRTHIARSVIDQNGAYGVLNAASVFSAGDNHIDDNGSGPVGGVALATDTLQ